MKIVLSRILKIDSTKISLLCSIHRSEAWRAEPTTPFDDDEAAAFVRYGSDAKIPEDERPGESKTSDTFIMRASDIDLTMRL